MGGWTYMLRCSDDSFYVGSTSYGDVNVRVTEHNEGRYVGYTWARRPATLIWARWHDDLRDAHEMERQLKGWSRDKKKALVREDIAGLKQLAARRAGKAKPEPKPTRRQMAHLFNSLGARHPEERAAQRRATKDAQ